MVSLLEREAELGRLSKAVERAGRGQGSVVLIGGEAGIGKTSLVRAARDREHEHATFLLGASEPLSVPVPLGPVRELFTAAAGGDLVALGSDDRLVLGRAVLAALATRAPAVAVVEDAHWADPLTLDVLRILARRLEDAGLVLLVTYRDDEIDAHPALGMWLGDLAGSPSVERIALQPLSERGVRELAGRQGLDAAELSRVTGGNPFLVVESMVAGRRVPASVRDAALARAGRLSPAARAAVDAAAVIGQRFDPALLAEVARVDAGPIDEAEAHGVLVADGRTLGFRHELIREALESSVAAGRRTELHARVVEVLSARGDAADPARLAHHAELAGRSEDACRFAIVACAEAERVGAVREVWLQSARALRLGASLEPDERFELLLRYARASNFSNPRLEDAVDAAEQALAVAASLDDPVRGARADLTLAWTLWSLEHMVEARAAVRRAIVALDSGADAGELSRAYAALARMEATAFDPEAALAAGARASELAEAAGLEEVRIDASVSIGLATGHRGDPQALELLTDALEAAGRRGLTIQRVRAYVNLTSVAVALRDHGRVDAVSEEALRLLRDFHTPVPARAIEFYTARSLLDRARWDEAVALAARVDPDFFGEFAVAQAIIGLIGARRGDPGAEVSLARAWEEIWRFVSAESARHGMIRLALVEAAWLRDDLPGAVSHLRAARDSPAVRRFARWGSELALWGARLGVELELPAGAPEPVQLELEGRWRAAAEAWRRLDSPYEAALAALPGDEPAARDAMASLHRLGARAAARAFGRERAVRGALAMRGPRRSTLAHPAGLTQREQEVLEQLATGATYASIAAALHLSERTVAHHVAAILRKLDAANRWAAVEQARASGLVTQDGQPAPPS